MKSSALTDRVNAIYARSNSTSWPDPHQDREATAEEYSRVTNPEKYFITLLRARAWVHVLGPLPDIDAEPLEVELLGSHFDRGVRLTSRRADTLPLLLLERDLTETGDSPMVCVSVAEPDIEIERVPDCGCDACDFGSANLVKGLDETIVEALNGMVLMLGANWRGIWTPDGGGVGGRPGHPGFDQIMAWGRQLSRGENVSFPEDVRVLVNSPWV
ncbi:DUF6226 family protein [Promicromonospora thailandica]|uniref:DUF6226 family protein n=1 Tax=Promicromonospora thailandica TaxID=765201 RepID=UPI0020A2789B|nr:DUF6226 family protein [Promicromonospora thailandica]